MCSSDLEMFPHGKQPDAKSKSGRLRSRGAAWIPAEVSPAATVAEMQKGPYGYHSVWKNIERLFTENTVQQVRMHLNTLHAKAP